MSAQLLTVKQPLKSLQSRRILVIEDDDINRMLLYDYLSYYGYEVQSSPEGSSFFTTIDKFQPDLILLDLKLPDINGYALLAQIQQDKNLSRIPVFVVSAFAFKKDWEPAMRLGGRRYFVKPVNLTELILAIEEELACKCL
ncbi:MAG: response regulator [Fischerella sp.]|nr:response regulator [Fischerella sp.]